MTLKSQRYFQDKGSILQHFILYFLNNASLPVSMGITISSTTYIPTNETDPKILKKDRNVLPVCYIQKITLIKFACVQCYDNIKNLRFSQVFISKVYVYSARDRSVSHVYSILWVRYQLSDRKRIADIKLRQNV